MNGSESVSADELVMLEGTQEPTRTVRVLIDRRATRQVITAFGGNFAVARFGDRDAHDSVGGYVLQNMPVGHARIGIPLKTFIKLSGDNYDAGHVAVKDVFRLMELLRDRKIPVIASVWDVPDFCLTDPEATMDRRIAPDKRDKVIAAITEWLRLARERHGCTVPYVSFSGVDGGGLLLIPPDEARYFITRGGAAFQKLGVPTKWLLGDTTSGESLAPYITAIMADKSAVPYLGPVAFHGWDSLSASDDAYLAIAKAAHLYRHPVWCTEAGYNAQSGALANPPVWDTWERALKLAESYARCLTLAEASVMDYWQYQNDCPIVGGLKEGSETRDDLSPAFEVFPTFHLLKMFTDMLPPETQIVSAKVIGDDLYAVIGIEPIDSKLRVLLVNTGESANITVSGGQPRAEYLMGGLNQTHVDLSRSAQQSLEIPPAHQQADQKGNVVVSMEARSILTLREQ